MNIPVAYEDHVPASALIALGAVVAGVTEDDDECFECGHKWPCPKAVAYNDGLNDGAIQERARIVDRLKIDIANYGEVGTVNFADFVAWIEAAS